MVEADDMLDEVEEALEEVRCSGDSDESGSTTPPPLHSSTWLVLLALDDDFDKSRAARKKTPPKKAKTAAQRETWHQMETDAVSTSKDVKSEPQIKIEIDDDEQPSELPMPPTEPTPTQVFSVN